VRLDDFTGPSRLNDDGVRWISPPGKKTSDISGWATAKDVRPEHGSHEGVPGHYFQMCLSWKHEDSDPGATTTTLEPTKELGFYGRRDDDASWPVLTNSPRSA